LNISGQNGPCPLPPNFPTGIQLSIEAFNSQGNEINIAYTYLAVPKNSAEVLRIANWAYQSDYRLRPSGSQHTWSPMIFGTRDNGADCPKVILLDTTNHFTSMILNPPDIGNPDLHSVSVGTGVKLRQLLDFLETKGLGLYSTPAIGAPTVGGMLALSAHGTGVGSGILDRMSSGHSAGSFSNLVMDMTIVAWDNSSSSYTLKRIHRSEEEAKVFLTSFGRTFITSVTLRVGKNQNLRTQITFFVTSSELFAHPDDVSETTRTISKFVETYGRVTLNNLPPSDLFWAQTIHNQPIKPPKSRRALWPLSVNQGAVIPFTKSADNLLHSATSNIPHFGRIFSVVGTALVTLVARLTRSIDIWGPSKNHFIYGRSDIPRGTANSFIIVTSRNNLQFVAHTMRRHFNGLWKEYLGNNEYPTPGILDFRVTGLDDPRFIQVPGAESPSFSPLSPVPGYPDFDIAIWMDTSGYTDTPRLYEFLVRLQSLLYRDLHGRYGIIRAEWSKGWAFTQDGAWRNSTILQHYARTFSSSDQLQEWNWAVRTLQKHDPFNIFSNSFLDELFIVR